MLLSNLINNAIQYAVEGTPISIVATADSVEISNSGLPLPFPEEKLFHRFQKGDPARPGTGNGLGLAIVKQICDVCHFTIGYKYVENTHCFTVNFAPEEEPVHERAVQDVFRIP
jgi:signal transduction histidine kinase